MPDEGLPPPSTPLRCTHPDCTLPSGGRCARAAEFAAPLEQCPELARAPSGEPSPPVASDVQAEVAPEVGTAWHGGRLSMGDVQSLLYRSPTRLIAVVGRHRAGKTSLLTSFALQLAQGQRAHFPYRFAGSRSLLGLHRLFQRASAWSGEAGREIVEYTKVSEDDDPSVFLHLALRPEDEEDDRVIDVLFSDVPGEWVEDQARHQDSKARRRFPWMSRADAVLVLADAFELTAERRARRADRDVGNVVRRVVSEAGGSARRPPVALVFTKLDAVDVSPPACSEPRPEGWGALGKCQRTWTALQLGQTKGIETAVFGVSAFPTAVDQGHPRWVTRPFGWAMAHADPRAPWPRLEAPIPPSSDAFQAVRRHR